MNAYIVDAKRTPIGRSHPDKGMYRHIRADEMLAQVLQHFAKENDLGSHLEDIFIGCVGQHLEQGKNIARLASLLAKYPDQVAGATINRLCGSSLQAFNFAATALAGGQNDVLMAGGVEHMQHVPMQAAIDYNQELLSRYEFPFTQMGMTAEKLAAKYQISRLQQDEYAFGSHIRAVNAQRLGFLKSEIIVLKTIDGLCEHDQLPRGDTSLEALAQLKTAFLENGTVTAGNSSPISDGASLCLMASAEGLQKLGAKPRARIEAISVIGIDPMMMGLGPVPAIQQLLQKTKMRMSDVDLFEINEAFASQIICCQRMLEIPTEKLNVSGGAIALGHPLGCTGTRLITTLLHELERTGKEIGVAALCVGHGQGMATMIRRVEHAPVGRS
jgi:acetyl-CoA acyltransferase